MKGYRKLLIAVNGSLGPLKEGLKVADEEKCWVTVLKVTPPYEGDVNLTGIKNINDVFDAGSTELASMLESSVREDGSLAKVRVEQGDISETISRVANEERCDLIIMGQKKQQGFLHRLLSGNVVKKVVRTAPCPVLVVEA